MTTLGWLPNAHQDMIVISVIFLKGSVPIYHISVSYAPHTSELYNVGLNSVLERLLQVPTANFWKSRKLFDAKIQHLHFSISIPFEFEKLPLAQKASPR